MTGPVARVWLLSLLTVPLVALSACGGQSDESKIEPDALPAIVEGLAVPGVAREERVITDKDELEQQVRDAGLGKHWKGGLRVQYQEIANVDFVDVAIDVYKTADAAKKRADGEEELTETYLRVELGPSVEVDPIDAGALPPSCSAISIIWSAIVPQYEVYCYVDTVVVYARTTGREKDAAISLSATLASDLTEALAGAIAAADAPD